jgi:hypothetical protein
LERFLRETWFLSGLFLTTLATLGLEILDTRLLSVLTWYHISFFAVSTAMFGMSAGAVHVYLAGDRFSKAVAPASLATWSALFAVAVPLAHVLNLVVPLPIDISLTAVAAITVSTLALAVPFYLSGVVVAVALTRVPGRIGRIYATDLVGASLGCILVIPLLRFANISSATFALGSLAALGSLCFRRFAGSRRMAFPIVLAAVLLAAALLNGFTRLGFRVMYPKGRYQPAASVSFEAWNTYSQVVAGFPAKGPPFYWGAGSRAQKEEVNSVLLAIDGEAGTIATQWNGDVASVGWTRHDVTSLPYHLRQGGDAAVIGVGGGRDVLTALWGRSRSVTGIEMNEAPVRLLRGPLRQLTALADRPEVELVHDEARSYLTRTAKRFDVLQMSLIDTWAATGAGAYTLSENGLYTLEAWRVFLGVLKPGGLFSVSRWFSPKKVSETTRLSALATAALLERGISNPSDHLALVSRGNVATLLVGEQPLSAADLDTIEQTAAAEDFTVLFTARQPPKQTLLAAVFASRSRAELDAAIRDQPYDYSPPTDVRPYFFNMLRLSSIHLNEIGSSSGVIAAGNLLATLTLATLGAISAALVVTIILWPLWRAGAPPMPPGAFTCALAYFSLIGVGFMMVQIPHMQRFSVYLGHPTYAIAVILFSMILCAGLGSLASDRLAIERQPSWVIIVPLLAAATIATVTLLMQPVIDRTVAFELPARCAIVFVLTAAPSLLLGFCFPIGMRLVRALDDRAMPWMWGVNGACGVLASVLAVAISMWAGIEASLYVAMACYTLLPLPGRLLSVIRSSAEDSSVVGSTATITEPRPTGARRSSVSRPT